MNIKTLNIKEVEHIAFKLAKELMKFNEPIPDYSTRYTNKLESCIAMPFMRYYKGLVQKAAILFYLIIKNHPFQNGNKRIAITTLLTFLYKNNKWLKADMEEFYDFTIWIANTPARLKNAVVKAIEEFIRKNIVDLNSFPNTK